MIQIQVQPIPQNAPGGGPLPGPMIQGPQPAEKEDVSEAEEKPRLVFPEPPRELRRALEDARKLLGMERFAEAGRKLDQILGAEEDFFFLKEKAESEKGELYENLKREAERLLEAMPAKGLELYEMEFGTVARLSLEEGISQGKTEQIAQVARRYFFTQAGSEATFLMGLHLMNLRKPVAACEFLTKLHSVPRLGKRFEPVLTLELAISCLAANRREEGLKRIQEAEKANTAEWQALRIGGKTPAELLRDASAIQSQDADALAVWLQKQVPVLEAGLPESTARNWKLMLQNQAWSANTGTVSMPILTPCWKVSGIDDPEGTVLLTLLKEKMEAGSSLELPTHAPLVVGNSVLMRTAWNLLAVDLQTGKRLWAVPTQNYEEIRKQLAHLEPSELGSIQGLASNESAIHQLMAGLLRHQVWGQKIYGALASDGTRVFCVEDSIQRFIPAKDSILSRRFDARRNPRMDPESEISDANTVPNRLACYDIRTGKLIWHLGGNGSQWSLPESGTMFLGVPLCVEDTLYVLGQRQGLVRLLALDSSNGSVRWSQTLCLAPAEHQTDPIPCTPQMSGGMLICPTPNHLLVGVDAVSHVLCWGNVYAQSKNEESRFFDSRLGTLIQEDVFPQPGKEVVAAADRILYVSSQEDLLCLDAQTGKTLWKQPSAVLCGLSASDGFLASPAIVCVRKGSVTVQSGASFQTFSLKDGTLQSQQLLNAQGLGNVQPAGRGFLADDSFFLPLADGRLVRLSADSWKVQETARLPESGTLGNLLPAGDFVLSQSGTSLDAFIQKSAAKAYVERTRSQDSDSPEALQVEAMMLCQQGKPAEAIAVLRKGGALTRKLMKATILEFLFSDSARSASESEVSASQSDSESRVNSFSDEEIEKLYAEMNSVSEKVEFCQKAIQRLEGENRWPGTLIWAKRFASALDAPKAELVASPKEDSAADSSNSSTADSENSSVSEPGTRLQDASKEEIRVQVPAADPEILQKLASHEKTEELSFTPNSNSAAAVSSPSVFQKPSPFWQSPDLWLSCELKQIADRLPAEDSVRQEMELWAQETFDALHARWEAFALSTKKVASVNPKELQKIQELQQDYAQFRLRFQFWKGLAAADADWMALVQFRGDFAALESYVFQKNHSQPKAAAELVKAYLELEKPELAGLYVRWLSLRFPEEAVLEGKTAAAFWRGLPSEHPIRRMLEPEMAEFPVGKILVKEVRKKETDEPITTETFLMAHETDFVNPFWGTQMRFSTHSEMSFGGEIVLCEDSLGRRLFHAAIDGNGSGYSDRPSFFSLTDSESTSGFMGSSIGVVRSQTLQLFRPEIHLSPDRASETAQLIWQFQGSRLLNQERDLAPYLKPLMEQIKNESLFIFQNRDFEVYAARFTPFAVVATYSDGVQRAVTPDSGMKLWEMPSSFPIIFQNEKLIQSARSMNPVCSFDAELLLHFLKTNENSLSEEADGDASESADSAEKTTAVPPKEATEKRLPLQDLIPYQKLENVSSVELRTHFEKLQVPTDWVQILKDVSVPVRDPQTGRITDVLRWPGLEIFWLSNDFAFMADPMLGFGRLNLKTLKFEWFFAWNPDFFKSDGHYYESMRFTSDFRLLYALNWKKQIEVFNLETGETFTLAFPKTSPAAEADSQTAKNSPETPQKPIQNPKLITDCGIFPDENGAFTAFLSYSENYEENLEEETESADAQPDAGAQPDANAQPNEEETNSEEEPVERAIISAPDDQNQTPLVHAILCRFDAHGKPLWEKSQFVLRSWLLQDLPSHLPVLGIAHQESVYGSSGRTSSESLAFRFLDRRNGQIIYDARLPQTQRLFMEGNPLEKKAVLALQNSELVFTFTDVPYSESDVVLSDSRSALQEQIRLRERELTNCVRHTKGLANQLESEKKNFAMRKDVTDDSKDFFEKRVGQMELELKNYRSFIEKEEKAIAKLKKELEEENARHGGPLPETPPTPEAPSNPVSATPEAPSDPVSVTPEAPADPVSATPEAPSDPVSATPKAPSDPVSATNEEVKP